MSAFLQSGRDGGHLVRSSPIMVLDQQRDDTAPSLIRI